MKKKIVIIMIVLLIAYTAGMYIFGKYTSTDNMVTNAVTNIVKKITALTTDKKIINTANAIENEIEKEPEEEKEKLSELQFSQIDIIDIMHRMANTKVVAKEKWGEIEITLQRVRNLKIIVKNSDFQDKDKLLQILDNWEKGDFSSADKEHNYLWEKLGGTVGEATAVIK